MNTILQRVQPAPDCALRVKPAHFRYNHSPAASNSFQHPIQHPTLTEIHENALQEFKILHHALKAHPIETIVIQDPGTALLPAIEYCGGGNARCMLTGVHLPRTISGAT